jgi:cell wall-associated NlpC family hydrolase
MRAYLIDLSSSWALLRRCLILTASLSVISATPMKGQQPSTPQPASTAPQPKRKKPFEAFSGSAQRLRDSLAAKLAGTSIIQVRTAEQERAIRDSIVAVARSQLGTKYIWGAESPGRAFDCSGLVRFVLGMFRLSLPRTANSQSFAGQAVPRDVAMLRPGDLLTFGKGKRVTHIGIYVGDGRLVHASTGKRRVVETTIGEATSWFSRHWLGARRLLATADTLVAEQ